MLSSHALYSDLDSPMSGIMIVGHDMDPNREDVRGQIIRDLSDAFGFRQEFLAENQEKTGAFTAKLLEAMSAENRFCRCVVYRTDDDGKDLQPLYFGLNEFPSVAEGCEEEVRYHWCAEQAEAALPVTVFEWEEELAQEIYDACEAMWRDEWNRRQDNKSPTDGVADD